MSIILSIIILFFFELLFLNGLSISHHTDDKKYEDYSTHHNPIIKDVENTFACIATHCYNIQEFRIAENYTMDCHNNEVLILFEIEVDSKMVKSFGYLGHTTNKGNYVKTILSERSKYCKSIKRLVFIFKL